MLERIKERLQSLGYTVKDSDDIAINFAMQKVENTIKNDCNISAIPDGLIHVAINMVVGEFLMSKKTFAPNDLLNFNLDSAIKQIQEGDTNISFAVGEGSKTDEQRLDSFIDYLLNYGRDEFITYRRFRW
nr:MAG TPA: head to tail adaptor [Caudoviricetes sp.]